MPPGTGTADRAAARRRFGLPAEVPCLLVFGGSLGARRSTTPPLDAFGARRPARSCTPAGGATTTTSRAASTPSAPRRTTACMPYIEPFADALAAADLVVARAGGSVLEVAAAGLPAILVPYPHATADHQTANARYMEAAGPAVVVPDAELDGPRLAREVGSLLGAPQRLAEMANAARAVARPDAADRIAEGCSG